MPGAQVIIYDKRKEVIDRQRSKRIWWQIWNANLKSQALPMISPENTRSRIWRIEARAGKKYLNERMNLRSIGDLRSRGGDALLRLTENIRYTASTLDTNRSRWPNAQIWDVYRRNLSSTLSEMISGVEPSLIRDMRRADLIQNMKAQMIGCSAVYANAQALDQSDLALTASAICANLDAWLNEDLALFGEKLALAGERYSFS